MSKDNKKLKQSVLLGALTSSFGIFISKTLGLLYYSPLSSMAGEGNMFFYGITYTYYDVLLKISGAGIPFAIAALVARYYAKEDYKTVLLVKKIGVSIVLALSFISSSILLLVANPLAKKALGEYASSQDIRNLQILFYILLLAIIFVPFLSAIRGYYQGLKRFDLYASSQVLEQFIRVFVIIFFGYLFVKILNFENIYAIFIAIFAAGIAAVVSFVYMLFMTKEDDKIIEELSKQNTNALSSKEIIKEIFYLGIPYVIVSVLGSMSLIVNSTFFLDYVTKVGMPLNEAKLSFGILQTNCSKLASIPQVLTLGFGSGLVPYLTESLENQDYKRLSHQIIQLLDTVLFILIPIIFIFYFFSKDIYFIMYGNLNLSLGSHLLKVYNLVTFTDTIAPIISSIMITLKMRKETIIFLIISCFIKIITFFPCIYFFKTEGLAISTSLSSLFVIILYLFTLSRKFKISFNLTFKRILIIIITSIIMIIPAITILHLIDFTYYSRLISILIMSILGLIMVSIYYYIGIKTKLIQTIFDIEDPSIINLLRRFRS